MVIRQIRQSFPPPMFPSIWYSLYEAHAKSVQDYNFEQQHGLKSGLLDDHPSHAFAQLLSDNPPEKFVNTPFGCTPKGSI